MKALVMSDIHGNKEALTAVWKHVKSTGVSCLILLGDLIDYGPHSNDVIAMLQSVELPVLCNIWGNHEQAIVREEYERFSTARGSASAKYTRNLLNANSWDYIAHKMTPCGQLVFEIAGKKCLAIHGSLRDAYWKAIKPGEDLSGYQAYDYVFSGHSHLPHCFAEYYQVDDPATRNQKKTMFLNPGSVGQPRNLCPLAQYAVWDTQTDEVTMARVPYDIAKEQAAFSPEIDRFYKDRLVRGV